MRFIRLIFTIHKLILVLFVLQTQEFNASLNLRQNQSLDFYRFMGKSERIFKLAINDGYLIENTSLEKKLYDTLESIQNIKSGEDWRKDIDLIENKIEEIYLKVEGLGIIISYDN